MGDPLNIHFPFRTVVVRVKIVRTDSQDKEGCYNQTKFDTNGMNNAWLINRIAPSSSSLSAL